MGTQKQRPTRRLLFVSSHRMAGFESPDTQAVFERYAFSLGAIGYHLEQIGWETRRVGLAGSRNPLRLARVIDEFKPDIIYTYGSVTALNPLLARRLFCKHRNFRVVHGWDDVYGDLWRCAFGWLPGKWMDVMERWIIKCSDAVVTLSLFNLERGRRWGVESHFIPNGANVPQFDPSTCPIHLEGRLKIVYSGDQARWKRTWEICEAMRHVPKNIKLYLTGGHYPYLDPYASENCIFLGYLPKNDQLSVLAQADVLAVTADQECNAKIQEYLRFGKPILGYDGRPNLFFTNGRNALLTRDYPAAIMRLADDPAFRRQLAENAARDLPVLSWSEVAAEFDKYFRGLMAGK